MGNNCTCFRRPKSKEKTKVMRTKEKELVTYNESYPTSRDSNLERARELALVLEDPFPRPIVAVDSYTETA